MIKRISGITAVAVLTVAGLALFVRPLSAQSLQMDGQLYGFAFQHSFPDYNGTRQGCRIYSDAAQKQASDNFRFRCGYKGARWDTNSDLHYWWCRLIHRRANILAELRNREMDLQRCLDRLEFEEYQQSTAYRW
jgi:hypothetical protein